MFSRIWKNKLFIWKHIFKSVPVICSIVRKKGCTVKMFYYLLKKRLIIRLFFLILKFKPTIIIILHCPLKAIFSLSYYAKGITEPLFGATHVKKIFYCILNKLQLGQTSTALSTGKCMGAAWLIRQFSSNVGFRTPIKLWNSTIEITVLNPFWNVAIFM